MLLRGQGGGQGGLWEGHLVLHMPPPGRDAGRPVRGEEGYRCSWTRSRQVPCKPGSPQAAHLLNVGNIPL